MANIYEEISKSNSQGGGKPDANLANDANNLGGVPAEQYATHKYVQNYHNTKESTQKEYIDQQDAKTLQEAKEYTNSQIRNQDFSSFAKVTDVQAVDAKLNKKIEECGQQCANNLATQIKGVVNDTNANFKDVNDAIGKLNSTQNNLFQSVSSGKQKIAGAITDKGVATSANDSYDTMAGNIRSIKTGGGELAPGFVNTSDGTATASDILLGKTAYAKGEKVYGTLIQQPIEVGAPTYGTDTSNATATANDIAYGKTAYARGQLIVGNMQNVEVEEIYGLSNEFNLQQQVSMTGIDPVTNENITNRSMIAFSKELDYCVSVATLEADTTQSYIESYAINNNGMYIQQSADMSGKITTKKYRYTLSELGIENNETIYGICLGCPGLNGDSKKCLLAISTSKVEENPEGSTYTHTAETLIHLYTYHLSEHGAIGKMYNNEKNVIENLTKVLISNSQNGTGKIEAPRLASFNNRNSEFFGILNRDDRTDFYCGYYLYMFKLLTNVDSNGNIKFDISFTKHKSGNFASSSWYPESSTKDFIVSDDDKYITGTSRYFDASITPIIKIDTNLSQYYPEFLGARLGPAFSGIINIKNTDCFLATTGKNLHYIDSFREINGHKGLYSTDGIVKLAAERDMVDIRLTPDKKKLIALESVIVKYTTSRHRIAIYNFEDILQTTTENTTLEPENTFEISNVSESFTMNYSVFTNSSCSKIIIYGRGLDWGMYKLETDLDIQNVVGVVYKGKKYYSIPENSLSANKKDVKAGKTFIGAGGYTETGTLETEVNNEQ